MENDKKILALLLSSAWFSSSNICGNISDSPLQTKNASSQTNGEAAYETAQKQAALQRQATFNSVQEMLNGMPGYKNKRQSEKDRFTALYTAIVLSTPEASTTLIVTNDEETPKLETTVAFGLYTALTQVLTSSKADKIWRGSVSADESNITLLYNTLVRPLKSNSDFTLKPLTTPPSAVTPSPVVTPLVVIAAPITHLVYTGQDLSQYPNLVSISMTVVQLRGVTDITSTKSLEISVTGDAANAPLSTERLVIPNAKIDVSAVTNLTNLTVARADTTSVKLPNTVTTLTVSTTTQVTGATALTTINLTGTTSTVPGWATDGSLTAANATLDLSAMTGLGTTVTLSGLNAEITAVILPTNVTTLTIPNTVTSVSGVTELTRINLTGAASTVPTWATDGSLTTTGATLDLSAMTGLPATLDLSGLNAEITTVILPTNVTTLTIPNTVTSVSGVTELTRINLTGAAPVPTWATNGSLTASTATLDLSLMTGLPATLDLLGLNADITTVRFPTSNTPAITHVVLPQTVNTIQNLPTTVTHLTANVSAFASIGAYGKGTFRNHITHVIIVDSTTTLILKDFLRDNLNLVSVDLSGLTAVTWIDEDFFNGCRGLSSLDLSGLSSLNSVGQSFFNKCSGLINVTLNALTNLTQIGDNFFKDCTDLTSVNLSGLTAVTSIGDKIFNSCSNLVTLTAKANIGANGTLSAAIVTAITVESANKFTRINLVGNATSLPTWVNNASMTKNTGATLDLSAMTGLPGTVNLTGLNAEITTVILPTNVTEITTSSTVTVQLVTGHPGLTRINLTGSISSLPGWISNTAMIAAGATLDLSAMTGTTVNLGAIWLYDKFTNLILPEAVSTIQSLPNSITHITASIAALATINAFNNPGLASYERITHVTVVDSTTTSIANLFLCNNQKLISVDLSGLTAVTSIGASFLWSCGNLTSINLGGLTKVTSISNYFLGSTSKLVTLTAKANTGANGTLSDATVTAITGQIADKFTRINLTGNATSLPAWVNNTSMTAATATLDLSAMTGLTPSFDFSTITNGEFKTLILPNGVGQSNTTGWANTSGTTWTR
jgi:hypothetical protein